MVPKDGSLRWQEEGALAFFSKQLRDADKNLKMMSAKAAGSKRFSHNLNEDWPASLKDTASALSAVGKQTQAGQFLRKLKDSSKALSAGTPFEELEWVRNFQSLVPNERLKSEPMGVFKRSHSDPDFKARGSGKVWPGQRKGQVAIEDWDLWKRQKKGQLAVEEWDVIKKVKEGLKEFEVRTKALEMTTIENMKKNVKSLGLTPPAPLSPKQKDQVPFLEPTEVLEGLVRQSEPILEQLGVTKEVPTKLKKMLRGWRKEHQRTTTAFTSEDEASASLAGDEQQQQQGQLARQSSEEEFNLRLASVAESTGYRYKGDMWEDRRKSETQCSTSGGLSAGPVSLRKNGCKIAIVTTAALPWMTGTSINPLLRAAYLSQADKDVTLLVPWLEAKDQAALYPNHLTFSTPAEQERYVRDWLESRVGFKTNFKIAFYPSKYHPQKRSILAVGDVTELIPEEEADVAVLEEPEHLTWYHHGARWTDKFKHVVGIVHTNYLEYARREEGGPILAFFLEHVNRAMARIYCHKVLRLSGATQTFPRSSICNVHGVSPKFLTIGAKVSTAQTKGSSQVFSKGAYFLGKMVWGKGYRELLDMVAAHQEELAELRLDVFGSGEDAAAVQAEAKKKRLPMTFYRARDHADASLGGSYTAFMRGESPAGYKVFINPSLSDVVATTTAEALAMGKIVVCAKHPSNDFFTQFPNCYIYSSPQEFVEKVKSAMANEPVPLTPEQRHLLSWEAATERFLDAAEPVPAPAVQQMELPGALSLAGLGGSSRTWEELQDKALHMGHFMLNGIEAVRMAGGGAPNSMNCTRQHYKDLGLDPALYQKPVYGL